MGNDEHSQNVFRKARELGLDPLAYCDQMEQEFREVWAQAVDLVRRLHPHDRAAPPRRRAADGAGAATTPATSTRATTRAGTASRCEAFKQEKDLVDGNCPIHLTKPDWIREKNYFFRLSKYQQPLLDHYAAHPEFMQPEIRRNEILRLLESGLEDISISRAGQTWGIPLPFDPVAASSTSGSTR